MILTTGIPKAPVVCRHDLRDFAKDKDVVNLYVLAIDQMMKIKQEDESSWFQLAAIHGRPYVPFDGVGQKGNFGGYCTHSSILFPSWHRPYLALFEQSISKHVYEIAREYKDAGDKERYLKAADRFRIPYWDWASDALIPDLVATQDKIDVHLPDGTKKNMKNPLFAYDFHPVYSDFGDGLPDEKTWEAWQETYRYPTTTDAKAKSDPPLMQTTLNNNRLTLRNRTYNILTQIKDYNTFSHDSSGGTDQNPAGFDSIESIHNQIHGLAGRNGHMGVVDYAAFDPVFWLHHTNVDRLFALWQILHPDVYVTPLKSETGTFTRKPGEIENVDSPLTPFRRTADAFWTSAEVRDTQVFNYTYPELERIQKLSKEEKIVQLTREVNRLYGATAPVGATAPSVFKDIPKPVEPVSGVVKVVTPAPATPAPTVPSAPVPAPAPAPADKSHYNEWIANIVVEKYAVKSSFFVHLFLGDVPADAAKWATASNLVGSHVIFANNATFTGCHRCRSAHEARKLVTGTIPLTNCLGLRLGGIAKLEPAQVLPYLQQNLHWRVERHDKTPIDVKDVPGLKVTVGHCVVKVPQKHGEFPTWGPIQLHHSPTAGRVGGT